MAASLIASAAPGAGLELVFSNLLKIVLKVRRENVDFDPTLQMIIETIEAIRPKLTKIEAYNKDFDRPEDTEWLIEMMKKGETLVHKCSKIHRLNFLKKPLYTKKLKSFDERLRRYLNTILLVDNAADSKETLFAVKSVGLQLRNLSMATSSNGASSSKGGVVGICSPPGLRVAPVGLEIPLKEMKEKLLNFCSVSEVVVVSALGGCGKTTLALALCQDDDVRGNFKSIFFVTVTKSPNLQVIIEGLFQHVKDMVPDFLSEEDATNQLENLFRFSVKSPILLVLDDVWSGAEPLIEKLKFPIEGYKILVTSRFEFPRFGPSYKLQTLNKADAMTLFQNVKHSCQM